MRKLFLIILILITTFCGFGQIHKRFIGKNGSVIKDSAKAVAYILFENDGSDSVWSAVRMDMFNHPLEKCNYSDEELTIPNGRFTSYQNVLNKRNLNDPHSLLDTLVVPKEKGSFIKGLKEGIWVEYFPDGKKNILRTYYKNELNGLYEEYDDPSGKVYQRSNYINSMREGNSYYFKSDGSLQTSLKFSRGIPYDLKKYNAKEHVFAPNAGYDFNDFINDKLPKADLSGLSGYTIILFTVMETGEIAKPEVPYVSKRIEKVIATALKDCPKWTPALYNGKNITYTVNYVFKFRE